MIPNINFRVIELFFKCQKLQTSAAAISAPWPHFQKLDVGINKFFSYLGFGIFPPVIWLLFLFENLKTKFKIQTKLKNYKKAKKKF